MSDRQQDPENVHPATGDRPDDVRVPSPTDAVPFRLIADFVVEAETAVEFLQDPKTTPEERQLLLWILTHREAMNRMCRMAIVDDLLAYECGTYFQDTFMGPDAENMLNGILPYLSAELKEYWTQLQSEDHDHFSNAMNNVFQTFHSTLKTTAIEDRSTGEEIPLRLSDRHYEPPDLSELFGMTETG